MKRDDDDQFQDGFLLRPLKRVTNGFHQRGLPCGLQVYFFCDFFIDPLILGFLFWLFYRSSELILSSGTTKPKMLYQLCIIHTSNDYHPHHQDEPSQVLMIKLCRRKLESWRGRRRALAFSTGCIIEHQTSSHHHHLWYHCLVLAFFPWKFLFFYFLWE